MKLRKSSAGKSKSLKPLPIEEARKYCKLQRDQDGFEVRFIDETIGRGVFTTKSFEAGEFLLEYRGELISHKEALYREKHYSSSLGSFLYFFKNSQHGTMCVDATLTEGMGRLINDEVACSSNCKVMIILVGEQTHLGIFVTQNIGIGSELRYDYGVADLPWRKKAKSDLKLKDPDSDWVPNSKDEEKSEESCFEWGNSEDTSQPTNRYVYDQTDAREKHASQISSREAAVDNVDIFVAKLNLDLKKSMKFEKPNPIECMNIMDSITSNLNNLRPGILRNTDFVETLKKIQKFSDIKIKNKATILLDQLNSETEDTLNSKLTRPVDMDLDRSSSGNDNSVLPDSESFFNGDENEVHEDTHKPLSKAMLKLLEISNSHVYSAVAVDKQIDSDAEAAVGNVDICVAKLNLDLKKSMKFEKLNPIECMNIMDSITSNLNNLRPGILRNTDFVETLKKIQKFSDIKIKNKAIILLDQLNSETEDTLNSKLTRSVDMDLDSSSSGNDNSVLPDSESLFSGDENKVHEDTHSDVFSDSDSDWVPYSEDEEKSEEFCFEWGNSEDTSQPTNRYVYDQTDAREKHASQLSNGEAAGTELSSKNKKSSKAPNRKRKPPEAEPDVEKKRHKIETCDAELDNISEASTKTCANNCSASKHNVYKKPKRYCIFCKEMRSKLSQHIASQHSDKEEVKRAMELPKKLKDIEFEKFKKNGIWEQNKIHIRRNKPLERERSNRKKGPVVRCGNCAGFYSKLYISRHSKKCQIKSEGSIRAVPVPTNLLLTEEDHGSEFVREVLSKFSSKSTSQLCTKDPILIEVGKRLWHKQKRKVNKQSEVCKSVMSDMRRLACLYTHLEAAEEMLGYRQNKEGNISDLFKRGNFRHLEEAIDTYTTCVDDTSKIKSGLKIGLYYLLKGTSKILKGLYLMDNNDNRADDIDKFVALLELNKNNIFGDAAYAVNQVRETKLRRPESMPLEEDIQALRHFVVDRTNVIVHDDLGFFDQHLFTELRDLVVCRLTLFNARRGGEPSRLRTTDWIDADKEAWLDKEQMNRLDPLDKALTSRLKITFFSGKGKHLVPVLFPQDTHLALHKLADPEIRLNAGVSKTNVFLFPSTNDKDNHVSGWHALKKVCQRLNLKDEKNVTATKNRHRVSTQFALMDVPESQRQFIYKHFGHSEETNKHIYQAPLAIKELSVIGPRLLSMDKVSGKTNLAECTTVQNASSMAAYTDTTVQSPRVARCLPSNDDEDTESRTYYTSCPLKKVKGRTYTQWKDDEADAVEKFFKAYYEGTASKRLPGKKEIEEFLHMEPSFRHSLKTIHTKVMNEVAKRERKAERI